MNAWERASGGMAHFGEADSRQVSSVGGPASASVAGLVQLPGASLGISAALQTSAGAACPRTEGSLHAPTCSQGDCCCVVPGQGSW